MHQGSCKKSIQWGKQPTSELKLASVKKITQEKPTNDKIIPRCLEDLKREIIEKYDTKIAKLTAKRNLVLAALDELID
jgi:hypothetical protein